jgi:hypothetical protein
MLRNAAGLVRPGISHVYEGGRLPCGGCVEPLSTRQVRGVEGLHVSDLSSAASSSGLWSLGRRDIDLIMHWISKRLSILDDSYLRRRRIFMLRPHLVGA